MSKAIYHQQGGQGVELEIIATRGDKVDLGRGEEILVRNCAVVTEPALGCATLVNGLKPEGKLDKPLASMTKEELLAYAAEHGVQASDSLTKAQIIEAISAAEASK